MKKVPVSSTNVEAIGYDEDSSTLDIEFKIGTT